MAWLRELAASSQKSSWTLVVRDGRRMWIWTLCRFPVPRALGSYLSSRMLPMSVRIGGSIRERVADVKKRIV